jgi:hypothetical protein
MLFDPINDRAFVRRLDDDGLTADFTRGSFRQFISIGTSGCCTEVTFAPAGGT